MKAKYLNRTDDINILNLALDENDGFLEFDVFENRAMNSSSVRNPISSLFKSERLREVEIIDRIKVRSRTIDSFCSENDLQVDFLKLDTEGNEYEILLGGKRQISKNVISIRVEVAFDHVFEGKKLFGSVSDLLLNEELALDYSCVSTDR